MSRTWLSREVVWSSRLETVASSCGAVLSLGRPRYVRIILVLLIYYGHTSYGTTVLRPQALCTTAVTTALCTTTAVKSYCSISCGIIIILRYNHTMIPAL